MSQTHLHRGLGRLRIQASVGGRYVARQQAAEREGFRECHGDALPGLERAATLVKEPPHVWVHVKVGRHGTERAAHLHERAVSHPGLVVGPAGEQAADRVALPVRGEPVERVRAVLPRLLVGRIVLAPHVGHGSLQLRWRHDSRGQQSVGVQRHCVRRGELQRWRW